MILLEIGAFICIQRLRDELILRFEWTLDWCPFKREDIYGEKLGGRTYADEDWHCYKPRNIQCKQKWEEAMTSLWNF